MGENESDKSDDVSRLTFVTESDTDMELEKNDGNEGDAGQAGGVGMLAVSERHVYTANATDARRVRSPLYRVGNCHLKVREGGIKQTQAVAR